LQKVAADRVLENSFRKKL